jgi:hypothetical protein
MPSVAGWYHCSVKPVSRSVGRSAVAAAAYRLGESLHDQRLGETYDYTRRSGIVTSFTVAPHGAPDWVHDAQTLWNAAEAAERRINSQVAREYELALPSAVSADEREGIARSFAQGLVIRYGVAVTVAIHEPSRYGDDRNFHAHILSTTRTVGADGFGQKTRVLDDRKTGPQEILFVRQYAAALINDALERAGSSERVDHRSFEARGIDREPSEHLGPTASEMEREGQASDKGDRNREIAERNREIDELVEELAAVEAEIAAEEERLLDEQYGREENLERDLEPSPDHTEPPATPETKTGFDAAADKYVETLTDGLRAQEPAEPWGPADMRPDAGSPSQERGSRTWWQQAEEYVAGFVRDIRERGEVGWRDGLTWWERAVEVLGTARDQVVDWASERWNSFVDYWRSDRDGPDMER